VDADARSLYRKLAASGELYTHLDEAVRHLSPEQVLELARSLITSLTREQVSSLGPEIGAQLFGKLEDEEIVRLGTIVARNVIPPHSPGLVTLVASPEPRFSSGLRARNYRTGSMHPIQASINVPLGDGDFFCWWILSEAEPGEYDCRIFEVGAGGISNEWLDLNVLMSRPVLHRFRAGSTVVAELRSNDSFSHSLPFALAGVFLEDQE
jgi:hypothetical protein